MNTDNNSANRKSADIACIIMASGEGKRFGSNKLLAEFGGKPLIMWAADTAKAVFENFVVVTRHHDVAQLCRDNSINAVLHSLPGRNDTVRLGLEHFGNRYAGYIFCQGDQPLLSPFTLQKMISCFKENSDNIIRLGFDSQPSSPVIFPSWAFEPLKALPQGKGGNTVAKANADKIISVSAQNIYETMDIDTPQDLAELEKFITNIK